MKKLSLLLSSFLFCVVVVHAEELTLAQSAAASRIFTSIMSPYCPGKLLSDCPSAQAHELKESIRSDIAKGKTESEILQTLKDQFGQSTIEAEPEFSGFALVAWVVPVVFFIIGFLFLVRTLIPRKNSSKA